jgi:nitrogen fixation NifU-like protein
MHWSLPSSAPVDCLQSLGPSIYTFRPPPHAVPDRAGGPAPDAADQEAILALFRSPHGKGSLPAPDVQATVSNPLCGEEVTVTVALDHRHPEPLVADLRFSSDGCSISQASASIMTDLSRGQSVTEIRARANALRALLRGDRSAAVTEAVGPLRVFEGVARLPARVACAMLPWEALLRALDGGAG